MLMFDIWLWLVWFHFLSTVNSDCGGYIIGLQSKLECDAWQY